MHAPTSPAIAILSLTDRPTHRLDLDHRGRHRHIPPQRIFRRRLVSFLGLYPAGTPGDIAPSNALQIRAVGALQQNGRTGLGTGLQKTSPEVCQNGDHRLTTGVVNGKRGRFCRGERRPRKPGDRWYMTRGRRGGGGGGGERAQYVCMCS